MKQKATHTPGPLEICGATHLWSPTSKANIASCSALRTIAHVGYAPPEIGDIDEVAANARRIAACWNALEGIDTEAVERYRQTAPALKLERLERQRDELLAALKLMRDAWDMSDETKAKRERRAKAWVTSNAAIAAATREKV